MPMVNLDTHILIYALSSGLKPRERRILESTSWGISGIVLWEIATLVGLGRIRLDLSAVDLESALTQIHVWPIDLETAVISTRLDFESDPADELIAATSLVHAVPLLTRDKRIRSSRVVPLA